MGASGFRSSCASVARNTSLRLIGFGELRRAVANAELQIAVQGFGLILGSLEALDEVVIVESQAVRTRSSDGIARSS
jgi:hypothetical protein